MIRRYLSSGIILALLLLNPLRIRADVIHGVQLLNSTYIEPFGEIFDDAFDLMTQTIVSVYSDNWDISWSQDMRGGLAFLSLRDCYGVVLKMPLEDLQVSPPLPDPLVGERVFDGNSNIYVVRTSDGLYAKFRILGLSVTTMTMEYYVQTDGSPSFGPSLPVQGSTWGRVKALYR
jgi:hypothetical protein